MESKQCLTSRSSYPEVHAEGLGQRRLEDVGVSLLEVPEGGGEDDVRSQVGVATLRHQQDLIVSFVPQDSAHGTVEPNLACWNDCLRERGNSHRRSTDSKEESTEQASHPLYLFLTS